MDHREVCWVRARLVRNASTATLLRIVSVLHRRGVEVHDFTFSVDAEAHAAVTARVTLGPTGRTTLEGALTHVLEVIDVSTRGDGPLDAMIDVD